jgi:hypothetical protein
MPRDSSDTQLEQSTLIRFVDFHEQYVTKYIRMADAKAGATFVATSAVLAYFLNDSVFRDDLKYEFLSWAWVFAAAAVFFLLSSAVLSFNVIAPRTPSSGTGVVFWGDVARFANAETYGAAILALSPESLLKARFEHSLNLSRVCADKYKSLRNSMRLGAIGVVVAMTWAFFWQALSSQ